LRQTLTLSVQPSAGCLAKTMSPGSIFLRPEAFQRRSAAAVALHCRTRRGVVGRSLFLRDRFEMIPACLRQSSRAGSRARGGFPTLPICQRPTKSELKHGFDTPRQARDPFHSSATARVWTPSLRPCRPKSFVARVPRFLVLKAAKMGLHAAAFHKVCKAEATGR
jgi:hypothetical protein